MSQLKAVITRLSPSCRQCLQQAARLCINNGHREVDTVHLLHELIATPHNDVAQILKFNKINQQSLLADITDLLHTFGQATGSTPVFSQGLMALLEDAWELASSQHNQSADNNSPLEIRSGHILLVLLAYERYQSLLKTLPEQLQYIDRFTLKDDYERQCLGSTEGSSSINHKGINKDAEGSVDDSTDSQASLDAKQTEAKPTPALDKYTYDLTAKASADQIDPVIGREFEIHQLIDILIRRRQNNPILTGEAGVGKTAVVEGLAQKIVAGQVPDQLKDVTIRSLDMGLLQAGASVKGEFENRLKQVIEEVQASVQPIILFIDEAHTLIGAGGQAGQNDAANLLKPALARGELRTIAATTWSEYKKYFEKDAALSRRFQVVKVDEPDIDTAVAMIRGLSAKMQSHFGILIDDDALQAAVELSARYISDRQLPDKAVSVLDTAAARVSLSKTAMPNQLDRLQAKGVQLEQHINNLSQQLERIGGVDEKEKVSQKIAVLDEQRQTNQQSIADMTSRWHEQRELNDQLDALNQQLNGKADGADTLSAKERLDKQSEYQSIEQSLKQIQETHRLIHPVLDRQVIKQIISDWTGIPLNDMAGNEKDHILNLADTLQTRVIGQDHSVAAIVKQIHTAKARLDDPNRPQGVFMLVGPSGVGKTETALALSEVLYGGERNLITINLSEYQEAHSVASLKGSPPGYVGYGEGGVLTEAIRRRPYSVLLLDEVEKAHPDVLDLFYQVFDKGVMEDSEGRLIDFKNTLILLTSNVGSSQIMQACINTDPAVTDFSLPDSDSLKQVINPHLYKAFKPAFLGRLTVIPYYPLTDDALAEIIRLKLEKITGRIRDNYDVPCVIDPEVIELILSRCHEVDSGARNADAIISHTLLPQLAGQLLAHDDSQSVLKRITVFVDAEDNFAYRLDTDAVVPLNQMAQYSESEDKVEKSPSKPVSAKKPAAKKPSVKKTARKKPVKEESL
ncbi:MULTISPECIES: type VI secretion system ATPase TssH [unclassified Psychrobacter]|uniref:type VI secretion system ATPase TssH n=1 Tax=unclassified Psychrobacter TaxID=196806 RepID=UPI0025B4E7F3|nr:MULTISPECIES: type VI secretion system ATPase TssH [unclassified Psychrobacter]MDN3453439.1 type VI secretion system ATPase TssH [Psychrobacter sp. APC 3350]MDN3502929.1 type VI secretion system ATPase TssH [Psychrobacter sp. 5A.1]